MKLAAVLAGVALLTASGAMGAVKPKVIGTRGAVESISADGGRVAIHAAVEESYCDSGAVWAPATGKVTHLADGRCEGQEGTRHYTDLTLGGSRLVWTNYDYGNHAYCQGPVIATLGAPKGKLADRCSGGGDEYFDYGGDGSLLVARMYLACEMCGPNYDESYEDDIVLYRIGTGVEKLAAEPRDTALLDVDAGRILLRDGRTKQLVVLNGAGTKVGGVPVHSSTGFMDGSGMVSVPTGTKLLTYDAATGKLRETCTLPAGAKVRDVENGTAVYSARGALHLVTIASNKDRVVASVKGLVDADLEPGGLFYAYNVPGGGAKPGRVAYLAL